MLEREADAGEQLASGPIVAARGEDGSAVSPLRDGFGRIQREAAPLPLRPVAAGARGLEYRRDLRAIPGGAGLLAPSNPGDERQRRRVSVAAMIG
ncbi:MAG: hypothetical protein ACYTF9_14710 [Planctomycetota bacterium]